MGMELVTGFLRELRENNNREWFEDNRPRYAQVQVYVNDLAAGLIEGISSFDRSVSGLAVKDTTYRLYRDTRFSKDKTPYKTHIGIYVCPGGKKSGNSGYYFHIEPDGRGVLGGHLLSSGIYMPEPVVLRSIREEVAYGSGEFLAAMKKAKGFNLSEYNKLRRAPQGYPADHPMAEYLKLKDYYLEKNVGDDFMHDPAVVANAVAAFKTTYDFSSLMNRCVQYAREEM